MAVLGLSLNRAPERRRAKAGILSQSPQAIPEILPEELHAYSYQSIKYAPLIAEVRGEGDKRDFGSAIGFRRPVGGGRVLTPDCIGT